MNDHLHKEAEHHIHDPNEPKHDHSKHDHAHHDHSKHRHHHHDHSTHQHPPRRQRPVVVKQEPQMDHVTHADHTAQDGHDAHGAHGAHEGHGGHGGMHEGHGTMMRNRFFVSLPLTIIVLLYSPMIQSWFNFTMPTFNGSEWIAPIVGTIIFFYGGLPFLGMARHELMGRQPGMMTLISLAITTAYLYSLGIFFFPPAHSEMQNGVMMDFFWELATLISVMLLGHWIEIRSVGQAQGALRELAKLLPDTAERILPNGETETVSVNDLQVADKILIRPGASIPADGTVIEGQSNVNEAMVTGESKPVSKRTGDSVIGGTVNGAGSLRVEIQQVGQNTALAGIMRLVEDAQKSQSRAQTLAQKAAFYLTIIAVTAGILTFFGWLLFTGSLADAVRNTVTVLVVACPHALGLAVPLVVAISTTLSARNGLLVRQRMALENAKDLTYVIFDKTGTLTRGEQGVVEVVSDGMDESELVGLAAGIEGDSEHPIAQAIRQYAETQKIEATRVTHFTSISGRGVKALHRGVPHYLGGPQMLTELELNIPATFQNAKQRAESAGQAVIFLVKKQEIIGMFAISDVIREESRDAVKQLHALGLKVAMLTGDSEAVARSVAEELNIDTYFAQVLPENKAEKVRELQNAGNKVAMVGDGVNDAPALVTADVGIAIGAGTDVAIESAGIILVRSNPLDIVKIIRLSRKTYGKMIQNLIWATGYNVVAIPLAMGVLAPVGILLDPAIGAVLMSVSTVVVSINAQLLRNANLTG